MKRIYEQTKKGVTFSCRYHIVWCTVFRRPILTEPMRIKVKGVIQKSCEELGVALLEEQVTANRITLQIGLEPKQTVHKAVYGIRRRCAAMLRKEYPALLSRVPSIFTESYFVSTEEKFPEQAVAQWIEEQPRSGEAKAKRRKNNGTDGT